MTRRSLVSLASFVLLALVACQTVPITGRSQVQLLPESEETRMGLQVYREILKKSRISNDQSSLPDAPARRLTC